MRKFSRAFLKASGEFVNHFQKRYEYVGIITAKKKKTEKH